LVTVFVTTDAIEEAMMKVTPVGAELTGRAGCDGKE
jgi:hypothetical protein